MVQFDLNFLYLKMVPLLNSSFPISILKITEKLNEDGTEKISKQNKNNNPDRNEFENLGYLSSFSNLLFFFYDFKSRHHRLSQRAGRKLVIRILRIKLTLNRQQIRPLLPNCKQMYKIKRPQ